MWNFTKFLFYAYLKFWKFRWFLSACLFGRRIVAGHMVGFSMLSTTRKWSNLGWIPRKKNISEFTIIKPTKIARQQKYDHLKDMVENNKILVTSLIDDIPSTILHSSRGSEDEIGPGVLVQDCPKTTRAGPHGPLISVIFLIHHYVGNLKKSKNIAVRQFGK